MKRKHYESSFFIFILLSLIIFYSRLTGQIVNSLSWDVFGYYLYLPALFLHGDLGLKDLGFVNEVVENYRTSATLYQITSAAEGSNVIKYPPGLAILYLPFFLIGILIASLTEFPVDGFSLPFQYSVVIGGVIYSIIGIFVLRLVLRRFFSDKISSLVLLILVLGTNYFHNAIASNLMPHNLLFTLYAFILLFTIKWHESKKPVHIILLGLVCGLTIISRLSEIVCLIIPVLWGVYDKPTLLKKWKLIKSHRKQVYLFLFTLFIVGLIQILYWYKVTGKTLYYSYQNPGEGLDFFSPHTINVLFSFRKGWLVYTPLIITSFIGFYFLYKKNRKIFYPVLIFFLVNLWLVSSWTNWWYAQSFGHRAFVQSYPVMAIPMGYFFVEIFNRSNWLKVFILVIVSFLLGLNLFQTWQYKKRIISGSRMTKEYYLSVFGRTSVSEQDKELLLIKRPFTSVEKIDDLSKYRQKGQYALDFEAHQSKHISDKYAYTGKHSFKLDSAIKFSPAIKVPFRELTDNYYAWIKASVWVYPTVDPKLNNGALVVTFTHKGGAYKYRKVSLADHIDATAINKWHKLSIEYLTPEVRSRDDKLNVYYWHWGDQEIFADHINVEVFVPKE